MLSRSKWTILLSVLALLRCEHLLSIINSRCGVDAVLHIFVIVQKIFGQVKRTSTSKLRQVPLRDWICTFPVLEIKQNGRRITFTEVKVRLWAGATLRGHILDSGSVFTDRGVAIMQY